MFLMASAEGEPFQLSCHEARELNDEEILRLNADVNVISEFKQNKLEVEAKKNWDLFYKRNTTKFFKDRHWTKREFEDLTNSCEDKTERRIIFEVGCGVGNFMFPLIQEDPNLYCYACDFSPRAVEFVKSHSAYDSKHCTAFQCDITQDSTTDNVPEGSVDIATLIFVLSAIHPDKMVQAVENIAKTLKPGGILLFRDYGLYDHAMLRFAKGHKLSDCFYVRQDGTRAFYFSLEKLNSIMEEAGLRTVESSYVHRSTVNKKEGVDVRRIFVQGKFSKCDDNDSVSMSYQKDGKDVDANQCKDAEGLVGHSQLQERSDSHKDTNQSDVQETESHKLETKRRSGGYNVGENVPGLPQHAHLLDTETRNLCEGGHSFQELRVGSDDNDELINNNALSSASPIETVNTSGNVEASCNHGLKLS